jgi:hypothetical protein
MELMEWRMIGSLAVSTASLITEGVEGVTKLGAGVGSALISNATVVTLGGLASSVPLYPGVEREP